MLRPVASGIGVAAATAAVAFTTFLVRGPSAGLIAAADAGNWPQWRGPARDGLSTETGLLQQWDADGPPLAWQSSGLGAGFSSVAVAGNRIYTMGDLAQEQFVLALDGASGTVLWKARVGPAWDDRYPGPRGTPTIDGELLYAVGTDGDLVCLETATGKERWRTNLERDLGGRSMSSWRFAESPLVDGDRVIVTPGTRSAALAALDKRTGETVWRTKRSIDFKDLDANGQPEAEGDLRKAFSTPHIVTVNGRPLLVSLGSKAAYGYDPETGREIWRIEEREAHSASTRPVAGHGLVFYPTGFPRGQLLAIRPDGRGDATASHVVWKLTRAVPNKPSLLLLDDLIFMVSDAGVASCVEAKTGEVVWTARVGGNFSASPLAAGGRVYLFSEEGTTTVIEAGRSYKVLAENTLGDGFMASPAVVGNALILRSRTHLYRVEE